MSIQKRIMNIGTICSAQRQFQKMKMLLDMQKEPKLNLMIFKYLATVEMDLDFVDNLNGPIVMDIEECSD